MPTVLVVDDDPALTGLLTLFLNDAGYKAVAVNSSKRALEIIQRSPPDVILLDLMMPVVSGSTLCKEVKASEITRHIPIIVISGDGRADTKWVEAGADACIIKPFDLDDVLEHIKRLCE